MSFKYTQSATYQNSLYHFNKGKELSQHIHTLLVSDNKEERKMATQIVVDLDAIHQKLDAHKKKIKNSSIDLPEANEIRKRIFQRIIIEHPQMFDRKPSDLIVPNIRDIESWLAPILILCCYDEHSKVQCKKLIENFFPFVQCPAQSNRYHTIVATLLHAPESYFSVEYKIEQAQKSIPQDVSEYQQCSWLCKLWLSKNEVEESTRERLFLAVFLS